jgi:hypothetical protein
MSVPLKSIPNHYAGTVLKELLDDRYLGINDFLDEYKLNSDPIYWDYQLVYDLMSGARIFKMVDHLRVLVKRGVTLCANIA